jgi:hypothetical protein
VAIDWRIRPTAARSRAHTTLVHPSERYPAGAVHCPLSPDLIDVRKCERCPRALGLRTVADAGGSVTFLTCQPVRS